MRRDSRVIHKAYERALFAIVLWCTNEPFDLHTATYGKLLRGHWLFSLSTAAQITFACELGLKWFQDV